MSIDVKIERMPVPYYLNKEEEISIPTCYIDIAELERGIKVIYMGAWLDAYDNVLPVMMMLCEEECERKIVHEVLHIVLYQVEGEKAADLLDVIDIRKEITQCGLEEPDLMAWMNKYMFPIATYDELVLYLQDQIHEQNKVVNEYLNSKERK